jgi:hypothetical protein
MVLTYVDSISFLSWTDEEWIEWRTLKDFRVVIAGCIEIILLTGQKISERLIALKFLTENLINDVADGCLFLTDKGRSLLLRGWPYFVGR